MMPLSSMAVARKPNGLGFGLEPFEPANQGAFFCEDTMIEVNAVNWTKEVKESTLPVLVDCSAEWCGPCKMLIPILKNVALNFEGRIKFVKLDVDNNMDLSKDLGVSSIPCLIMFKEGHETGRIVGYSGVNPLIAWLEKQEKGSAA